MRRECVLLYPPPPRKQPDVWRCLGAPHRMGIRKTVSNEGSQGSRKTGQSARTKCLCCLDPLGSRVSAWELLSSGLLSIFPRWTSVLLLFSPSPPQYPFLPTISRTGTVIRRGPAPEPALRMAFGAPWPSEQRGKQTYHRAAVF